MTDLLIPILLCFTALWGLHKKVDIYAALLRGAREGLRLAVGLLPPLIPLLTAIAMLRASGALDLLARCTGPVLEHLGLPPEVLPLMLVRPLSGSGALATTGELLETYGPDSTVGRVASVMMGSTETTFYTIAVYYGAAGITRTRHTVPAALAADCTGFLVSALAVRLFFGT